jgi:hypothetical protein
MATEEAICVLIFDTVFLNENSKGTEFFISFINETTVQLNKGPTGQRKQQNYI